MTPTESRRKCAKVIPLNHRAGQSGDEAQLERGESSRDEMISQQIVVILKDMLQSLRAATK